MYEKFILFVRNAISKGNLFGSICADLYKLATSQIIYHQNFATFTSFFIVFYQDSKVVIPNFQVEFEVDRCSAKRKY